MKFTRISSKLKVAILCTFILIFSGNVHSTMICESEQYTASSTDLIRRTSDIYLVKLVGIKYDGYLPSYRFKVLRTIKGRQQRRLKINGLPLEDVCDCSNVTFSNHTDSKFVMGIQERTGNILGRNHINSACLIFPSYKIGRDYLLFRGQRHVRADEEIQTPDDAWLKYVIQQVQSQSAER